VRQCRRRSFVLSSRRGPESLAGKTAELGRGASAATIEQAASLDYVLLAVPWPNVEDALRGLPVWNGRVLIDATNPFSEYSPNLVLADLGDKGASEIVAGLAPGARVVKAFNSIVIDRFNEGPIKDGGRRVIFVSGDDPEPVEFVKSLIASFGFVPVYLGGLWSAAACSRRAVRSPVGTSSISATTEPVEKIALRAAMIKAFDEPTELLELVDAGACATGRRRDVGRCRVRADQHE
jgi:8-hydroxy-5-deazaflavin:NADPH oxidoreductase